MSLKIVCHNKIDQLLKAIAEGVAMDKSFSPDTPREQLLTEIAKLKLAAVAASSGSYASKTEVSQLKEKVTALESSNSTLTQKVAALESAKATLESGIDELKRRVTALEGAGGA